MKPRIKIQPVDKLARRWAIMPFPAIQFSVMRATHPYKYQLGIGWLSWVLFIEWRRYEL